MKKIFMVLFLIFILTSTTYAEEITGKNNSELCPGVWIIINHYGWAVQNSEGLILPLSHNTLLLGCRNTPIQPYPELAGAKAEIKCKPSPLEFGLPDVTSVSVICE